MVRGPEYLNRKRAYNMRNASESSQTNRSADANVGQVEPRGKFELDNETTFQALQRMVRINTDRARRLAQKSEELAALPQPAGRIDTRLSSVLEDVSQCLFQLAVTIKHMERIQRIYTPREASSSPSTTEEYLDLPH